MAHQQAQNYVLSASNNKLNALWKLTRVMKAAGWRYKASSDGTTKESAGNPNNDKWGGGGTVQGPTTVAFTIGSPNSTASGGRSTISGLAAMATTSVGHFLKITGATNGANNGTWLITQFISATSVQIENPAAVAETTPGTATYTELSALTDTFPALGGGSWWNCQGPSTLKVPIGTAVPTGTFIKGEDVSQSVTGCHGEVIGVYTDTINGGYLVICPRVSGSGSGPRGWNPSGTITGATSGATVTVTATVLEYIREIVFWDNTSLLGHIYYQCIESVTEGATTVTTGRFSTMAALASCTATVCPGGAATINSTMVATGTTPPAVSISGTAPFTNVDKIEIDITLGGARGTALFQWKLNGVVQATGVVTAATNVLGTTGLTANFPVGTYNADNVYTKTNDPTANGWPTAGTMVVLGAGGPGLASTASIDLLNNSQGVGTGKAQIMVANAIEDSLISADGSLTLPVGVQPIGATQYEGWGFQRLDDVEDGELEPYIWAAPNTAVNGYNRNRSGRGNGGVASSVADGFGGTNMVLTASTAFYGFRRRGLGGNESFQEYFGNCVGLLGGSTAMQVNTGTRDTVACSVAAVSVRDPIWVVSYNVTQGPLTKSRKGSLRWWFCIMGNASNDTYDTKRWVQLSSTAPAVVAGPADQTTTPVNQ